MILPWLPLLAAGAAFFDFCVDEAGVAEGVGFVAGGGASSSEKDSHAASWMVTVYEI